MDSGREREGRKSGEGEGKKQDTWKVNLVTVIKNIYFNFSSS